MARILLSRAVLCLLALGLAACSPAASPEAEDLSSGGDVHIGKPKDLADGLATDLAVPLDTGDMTPHDGPTTDALLLCTVEAGFGCECQGPEDCLEGWCVDSPFGKVCTQTCIEECPLNWQCTQAGSPAEPVFICLPTHLWLCRPCKSSDECVEGVPGSEDKCVLFGSEGAFCGGSCQGDEDCPEGTSCSEHETVEGGFSLQCVPDSMTCTCTQKFIEAGSATFCDVVNEFGACPGERSCMPDGLSSCEGPIPAAEECNGLDDDCDGEIDEELGGTPCDITGEFGTCPGESLCVAGEWDCLGQPAQPESCNGIDDDCDGETDEQGAAGCLFYHEDKDGDSYGGPGVGCVCEPTPEYPAAFEDDCNDEDGAIHPGAAELCATEADDNCDGVANDAGANDCTDYTLDADQDGFGIGAPMCLCAPIDLHTATEAGDCADDNPAVNPGAQEVCDGLDNNCNGLVDEGFPDSEQDGLADCVDPDDDNDGEPDLSDCQPYNPGVPGCSGKECGDNGCGGSCGVCPGGSECVNFLCTCTPDCTGKQCGDDGCGGSCGNCPVGWVCQDGLCQCLPNCLNKECGSDGCGGNCGDCPPGHLCQNGFCICQPSCVNKQCGDDGCGGTCGTCPNGYVCQNNLCICQPQCVGKQCGADGCGGSCGTCPNGYQCTVNGQCEALPNPCGNLDWAGQCVGNTLQYCHAAGNPGSPCYSPPNCAIASGDCDLDCWQSGYSWGACECGYQPSICVPESYCCYCSCY